MHFRNSKVFFDAVAVVLDVTPHLPADTTAMLKTPQHDRFAILWKQYILLI
jgi:hypothetical protein